MFRLASASDVIPTKRGLAESTAYGARLCTDLDLAQLAWHYSWSVAPGNVTCDILSNATTGTAFVAMAWGASSVPITGLFPASVALLGFNEPNRLTQANMTPAAAAALWPSVEATARQNGLSLGSPAVVTCTSGCAYVRPGHVWPCVFPIAAFVTCVQSPALLCRTRSPG
jgi:hypothetical protein